MRNFVFISPNFPTNYWQFCHELKNNGLNVLGIGDQPYDELIPELKNSLTEYYKVDHMEDYDQMYRAVAYFIFKYGRIDYLESNNEYWLEQDARLRTDFNITTGFQSADIPCIKYKSKMKEYYKKAGIPTARYYLVSDLKGCKTFLEKVCYPVVVKPDNGVGAAATYKLRSDADLEFFMETRPAGVPYIMEEFVNAQVNSYDAIIDGDGNPIFETGNVTVNSVMDVVNDKQESIFYIVKELAEDIRAAGRATVKSFGVKNRFVHLEFFRLLEDNEALGKAGDVIGLEVNMRPSGGLTPDMINYARSTNVYKIWADMMTYGSSLYPVGERSFCVFAGRWDGKRYKLDHFALMSKYGKNMKMVERVPGSLADAMGNMMYMACFTGKEQMEEFYKDIMDCE